jgi:hypothetical protein
VELNICSATIRKQLQSFRVSFEQKMGTLEMNRYDEELLDKQMWLSPPQNESVIALMLAATFLVGIAVGSVL